MLSVIRFTILKIISCALFIMMVHDGLNASSYNDGPCLKLYCTSTTTTIKILPIVFCFSVKFMNNAKLCKWFVYTSKFCWYQFYANIVVIKFTICWGFSHLWPINTANCIFGIKCENMQYQRTTQTLWIHLSSCTNAILIFSNSMQIVKLIGALLHMQLSTNVALRLILYIPEGMSFIKTKSSYKLKKK